MEIFNTKSVPLQLCIRSSLGNLKRAVFCSNLSRIFRLKSWWIQLYHEVSIFLFIKHLKQLDSRSN